MNIIIKRLIFGKKYIKIRKHKEKVKYLELSHFLLLFTLVFVFLSLIFLSYIIIDSLFYFSKGNLDVQFEGLDNYEINRAKSMINDINPIYLQRPFIITFTNNISKYCDNKCYGLNIGRKNIFVGYQKDYEFTKETLCHELLHGYLNIYNDEDIVADLAQYLPCYKKRLVVNLE